MACSSMHATSLPRWPRPSQNVETARHSRVDLCLIDAIAPQTSEQSIERLRDQLRDERTLMLHRCIPLHSCDDRQRSWLWLAFPFSDRTVGCWARCQSLVGLVSSLTLQTVSSASCTSRRWCLLPTTLACRSKADKPKIKQTPPVMIVSTRQPDPSAATRLRFTEPKPRTSQWSYGCLKLDC